MSFGRLLAHSIGDDTRESFLGVYIRGVIPINERYGAELYDRGDIFYHVCVIIICDGGRELLDLSICYECL